MDGGRENIKFFIKEDGISALRIMAKAYQRSPCPGVSEIKIFAEK